MFDRSPSATSGPGSTPASLPTGALSPVSAASCASSVAEWTSRPSAGTMSPASTCTMSPGTTSTAGTSASAPSRTTFACGTCRFDSASTLARAFSSCREPSTTLRRISSADHDPRGDLADREAHHHDRNQHDVHRIAELAQRDGPHRRRLLTRDLVRPEPLQPLRRVRRRSAPKPDRSRATPPPRLRRRRTAAGTRTPWPRLRDPAQLPLSQTPPPGGQPTNHRSCTSGRARPGGQCRAVVGHAVPRAV